MSDQRRWNKNEILLDKSTRDKKKQKKSHPKQSGACFCHFRGSRGRCMSLSGDLSCEVSTSRHYEDCMNMRTHAAKQRGSVLVQEGPPGFQKVPVFGEKQGPEKRSGRFG